ncbi:DUF192 domain-containing protein [Candidatus Uhrbacteria bacterium]|nr:DUF192 domain-containing protein [Candidatus Uhrbacteria bacterium]
MNPGSSFGCWKVIIILFCILMFVASIFSFSAFKWLESLPINSETIGFDFKFNSETGEQIFKQTFNTTLNGKEIELEIADEPAEIRQGLSDRKEMGDAEGMLFLLERGHHPFWMNRMHFSLDMIWIDQGIVVDIARDVPPPSETGGVPVTRDPGVEADMVLELTAGGAERYEVRVGQPLDIEGLAR